MNRATEQHRAPLRRRGATTIRWSPPLRAPRRAVAPGQGPQPPGPPASERGRRPVSGTRAESRARVGTSPLCGSHERDRRLAPLRAGPPGRLRDPGRGLRSGRSARIRAGARTGPPPCVPRSGAVRPSPGAGPRAPLGWVGSHPRGSANGTAALRPQSGAVSPSPGQPAPSPAPVAAFTCAAARRRGRRPVAPARPPRGPGPGAGRPRGTRLLTLHPCRTAIRGSAWGPGRGLQPFPGRRDPSAAVPVVGVRRGAGRGDSDSTGAGPSPLRPGHGARSRRRRTARQPPPGHAPHTPLAPLRGGAGAGRVRARVSLAGCAGGWPSGAG